MEKLKTKQVIVVRTDLNMGVGKIAAQTCHASLAFVTRNGRIACSRNHNDGWNYFENNDPIFNHYSEEINDWMKDSFKKVCVAVNSLEALLEVQKKALKDDLICNVITDSGRTVFNGNPTVTCLALGPHWDERFEGITNHLPLL